MSVIIALLILLGLGVAFLWAAYQIVAAIIDPQDFRVKLHIFFLRNWGLKPGRTYRVTRTPSNPFNLPTENNEITILAVKQSSTNNSIWVQYMVNGGSITAARFKDFYDEYLYHCDIEEVKVKEQPT